MLEYLCLLRRINFPVPNSQPNRFRNFIFNKAHDAYLGLDNKNHLSNLIMIQDGRIEGSEDNLKRLISLQEEEACLQ